MFTPFILPLIAEWCSPCRHHRERRRLSRSHRLAPLAAWVIVGDNWCWVHRQRRRRAGHRSCSVRPPPQRKVEPLSDVVVRRTWCNCSNVAPCDVHAVLLPLIAQRRCSTRHPPRTVRRLSRSHRLAPWLRSDRRRHGCWVHGQRRRRTRHRSPPCFVTTTEKLDPLSEVVVAGVV